MEFCRVFPQLKFSSWIQVKIPYFSFIFISSLCIHIHTHKEMMMMVKWKSFLIRGKKENEYNAHKNPFHWKYLCTLWCIRSGKAICEFSHMWKIFIECLLFLSFSHRIKKDIKATYQVHTHINTISM